MTQLIDKIKNCLVNHQNAHLQLFLNFFIVGPFLKKNKICSNKNQVGRNSGKKVQKMFSFLFPF